MQLLLHSGLRRRSYLKSATMGVSHPDRNAQFERIAALKEEFLWHGFPVLSIDTKKKELLGNLHRQGHYYDNTARKVNDHDFESYTEGKLVPHGLYDLSKNKGYITLGTSKDTSAFICDNIATFLGQEIHRDYPGEDWMLLLCDGGGSNNARHYIVKQDLCLLAKRIQMNILVAHYPPYCSKYNPIEHRLLAHLHHAWSGSVLFDIQIAKELAEKTSIQTGLSVSVNINQNTYETKRVVDEGFKSNISQFIDFDEQFPLWNFQSSMKMSSLFFERSLAAGKADEEKRIDFMGIDTKLMCPLSPDFLAYIDHKDSSVQIYQGFENLKEKQVNEIDKDTFEKIWHHLTDMRRITEYLIAPTERK